MPDKQLIGLLSRRKGQFFEELLLPANQYYENKGIAVVEKTPKPRRKPGQFNDYSHEQVDWNAISRRIRAQDRTKETEEAGSG